MQCSACLEQSSSEVYTSDEPLNRARKVVPAAPHPSPVERRGGTGYNGVSQNRMQQKETLCTMNANASCSSASTQHSAICADWCGLLASNTVAPSWRNGIFCVFCACNGVVCPSSKATLTSKVSHADFDAAAAALAHAFASGLQPPLVHLVRVLDGVSHNAEQAFINSGEPANKVLSWPQMASDDIGLASQ